MAVFGAFLASKSMKKVIIIHLVCTANKDRQFSVG